MTIRAKCGTLNITTGTSPVAVTGLGFKPDLLILVWSGLATASNGTRTTSRRGIGCATSASNFFAQSTYDGDGLGTAVAKNNVATDSCVIEIDNTGAIVGKAALTSFDSDGFTITPSDAFVTDLLVSWYAVAGVQAECGVTAWPGATGNLTVNNAADFQPDFTAFFVGSQIASGADSTTLFGAATGASNQGALWTGSNDASANASAGNYCLSSECIATHQAAPTVSPTGRAQFVSHNAGPGGFTVNVVERNAASPSFAWLSVRGGLWKVGNLLTRTDGNPITVTGLGFVPAGLIFVSAGNPQTTGDAAPTTHDKWSIGFATGPSNRVVQQVDSRSGQTDMYVHCSARTDAAYVNTDPGNVSYTLTGLMDLTSLDSDGFSCVMDDTDPAQAFVFFIAAGNSPAGAAHNLPLLGVGS